MEFDGVFIGFLAIGCGYAFFAGSVQARLYFPGLIAVRTRWPGWRGWVLVGLMAALAFLGALVLIVLPSIVMFGLMLMDQPSAKFPAAPFLTASGLFLLPFIAGAGRVRERYDDRLNALGLRFN